MRAKYLFDFANICHVSPDQVDALRLYDFCNLKVAIDQYREANKPNPS